MFRDNVPRNPNVSITSTATPDSERFQFHHHDGILTITMNVRRSMIVGVNHDVETVLSQNRRHGLTIIQTAATPKRDSPGRPCDEALTPNKMNSLLFKPSNQRDR